VNPAPLAQVGKDTSICFGTNVQLQGSGGVSYLWSPADYLDDPSSPDPIATKPLKSISYQLKVVDANGCSSLNDANVAINVLPPLRIFAGNDTAITINQPLQLNAMDIDNNGFIKYEWSPAYGLNDPAIKNPVAILDKDMTYTVTGFTANDCEGQDDINIKVIIQPRIIVPNGFTPNGDGKNDILRPKLFGIRDLKYFAVFNRWGERVYYSANADSGWDGKINGILQNSGTFVWEAAGVDYKGNIIKEKGTVVLIR
jgi:gliding motility-associated-like protein